MRTLSVVLILLLTSCGVSAPKSYFKFSCPHAYSDVIQADKYIFDIEFVPGHQLPDNSYGEAQLYWSPADMPLADPDRFPFFIIRINEDLYGALLEKTIFHEKCHVYDVLHSYDISTTFEDAVSLYEKSGEHFGWHRHPFSVDWGE